MSYWRVMSGLQMGAYAGKQFQIFKKHYLRTDLGPILRFQFNSNDGFGVYYPPEIPIPFLVYAFENTVNAKRNTFAIGAKVVIQYRYLIGDKWQVGLHASAQIDSQGDHFYNYGLTFTTNFIR
jgi:hypothetical protein